MKNDILKSSLCESLIKNNIVKEFDIVKHSYTNQIMSGDKKCIECNNMLPTLTTRPDCIGVCVKMKNKLEPKCIGGIGEKKSNNGTQFYEQNRIYENSIATTITSECSFHPYYKVDENGTTRERERVVAYAYENSLLVNVCYLWALQKKIMKIWLKPV